MWYRDRGLWGRFLLRYLPSVAIANLFWEVAQLPLYTLWAEASPGYVLYAVLHCTAGDVLIAGSTLLVAICLVAPRRFPQRGLARVAIVAMLLGLAYTVFSEWLNTVVRVSWAYSPSMPIVPLLGVGLAPFLQWLLLPPLVAFFVFRRHGVLSPRVAAARSRRQRRPGAPILRAQEGVTMSARAPVPGRPGRRRARFSARVLLPGLARAVGRRGREWK